ncbi:hypothetical protein ACMGGS_18775 [Superficieibacter sp. BNK-5]|jgi:hypothetical protein|uniref:hypothetical protein n=1 Tax=Superficieibacter sp. BNK-5 TaxID=3376142 RepID=UPI002904CF34|nr:hypothetical protein [Enterobacteriaceae bacterium]
MASKSLWAIVGYLRENQTVTPRQVQALLGCDCKKAHNLLLHLIRRSVVLRIGEPHHPVFTLQPGGESNIKRPKPAAPSVADVCRQNWQGYEIHKIFGSARA